MRPTGLIVLCLLLSCSGSQSDTATADDSADLGGSTLAHGDVPPSAESTTPEVSRAGLAHILGESPGHFFGLVHVEGVGAEGGSFAGWRIESLPTDTPSWLDVRVGDVVTSVNGMPIERPEEAQQVYEALRVASEVRIELTRGDERRAVRIPIVDAAGEPSSPAPDGEGDAGAGEGGDASTEVEPTSEPASE